jgi:hypothetical protein
MARRGSRCVRGTRDGHRATAAWGEPATDRAVTAGRPPHRPFISGGASGATPRAAARITADERVPRAPDRVVDERVLDGAAGAAGQPPPGPFRATQTRRDHTGLLIPQAPAPQGACGDVSPATMASRFVASTGFSILGFGT